MSENVRQHAVPRFYLALFAGPDGNLRVLEPETGRMFRSKPGGVAVERDCYTITTGTIRDTRCDDVNTDLEGHCAPQFRALSAGSIPTTEQWRAIWILASNLITRSRRSRDSLSGPLQEIASVVERMADVIGEQAAAIRADLRRAAEVHYPITVAGLIEPVAGAIAEKPLKLLIAPSGTNYVTSDDPVVVLHASEVLIRPMPDDLRDPEVELYFPLSPRLAAHWGPGDELGTRAISSVEVAMINRLVRDSCWRQIYASSEDDLRVLRSGG